MKKNLSLLSFAVVMVLATQASAAWAPSYYRCAFDQITSQDQSRGRQQWAKRWAALDPYNISPGPDSRFWASLFNKDADDALGVYGIWIYPVYVDPDQGYDPVQGPGAYGSATAGLTGDQIVNLAHTQKQVQVLMDGVCEPGCYMPDQKVLFQGGEIAIQEAQEAGAADMVTLSEESTLTSLKLVNNTVERYTLDRDPAKQEIYTIRTRSGGSLSVTTEHPLVTNDGMVRKAKELVVGDFLVKQDGRFDEITSIDRADWFGRVYNLRPVSRDLVSNILVAQGYLNGSGRYQSEFVQELNRVILRNNVPDNLIPQD